jgi:predicted negative regulator of RcsB-dependent stress response
MLTASEKVSPDDYNPPARLARVYLAKSDIASARAAIARAKAKVYGPRSVTILLLEADIALAAGDKTAAKAAYESAKKVLAAQTPTASSERRRLQIERSLSAL